VEYLIRTYSNKGDLVLDNVMGSGTTGIAAAKTNRDFIGIEKENNFFDLSVLRIGEAILDKSKLEIITSGRKNED